MKYFSQSRQDHFLDYYFSKKEKGVFVDIGAHDGVTYSNTCFFERYRNWTGLCVEPIPEVFAQLDKNRSCIKANYCIGKKDGPERFLRIKGYSEMLSGIYDNYEESHLQRIKSELEEFNGEQQLIDVQSIPLGKLLTQNGINKVDFLSIDVEGSELMVLESIDFKDCHISLIIVENNYDDPAIGQFLEDKDYKFLRRLGKDDLYLNGKDYSAANYLKARLYSLNALIGSH